MKQINYGETVLTADWAAYARMAWHDIAARQDQIIRKVLALQYGLTAEECVSKVGLMPGKGEDVDYTMVDIETGQELVAIKRPRVESVDGKSVLSFDYWTIFGDVLVDAK